MDKEENFGVSFSNNENTCQQCLYGVLAGQDNLFCAKYNTKPYSVYYDGKDCKFFKKVKINAQK